MRIDNLYIFIDKLKDYLIDILFIIK